MSFKTDEMENSVSFYPFNSVAFFPNRPDITFLDFLGLLLSELAPFTEVEMQTFVGEQIRLQSVPKLMNNDILHFPILSENHSTRC